VLRTGLPLQQCAAGSTCDRYGTKTCVAVFDAGSPCTSDDDCPGSLRCLGSGCSLPSAAEQSCSVGGFNGLYQPCQPELFCLMYPPNAPGKCKARVDAHQPCAIGTDCKPGLWCDRSAGQGQGECALPRPAGAACELSAYEDQCRDGLFCDFNVTHTCVPKKTDGGSCDSDYLCAAGFRCDNAACGPDSCR
jgi:hypothetical protein